MYSKSQQQALIKRTGELVKKLPAVADKIGSEALASELRALINFHDWRYYVLADPIIVDFDYDTIFKTLKEIEEKFPNLKTEDSPTQRVARGLTEDFPTVEHTVPMLSLDNSYNAEDLEDFDRKVREITGSEKVAYSVEPKFDGSSIALVYENDFLVRAATRGNGIAGEEITNNAKVMRSVPLSAKFSELGIHKDELRGEVVIEKNNFEKINERRREEGLPELQNPRTVSYTHLTLPTIVRV